MKRILIIGASGFVGNYLFSQLKSITKYIQFGTNHKSYNRNLISLDYTNSINFLSILSNINPDVIIWSAGIKDFNLLENDHALATNNNVKPIETIVEFINKANKKIHFIFISSDYVFNGEKGNYNDKQIPNPNTIYGKSKLIAEKIIQKKIKFYSIIRVGAVFAKGSKFFDWLINELKNSFFVDLYDDIFSPTPLETLFLAIQRCIEMNLYGIFHISGNKKISRYDLGIEIKSFLPNCKTLVRKVKKNPQKAIDRSLKRSSEFSDFKNLELKEIL
ncbi:sugar nucleotide-binding protein [Flavobacteriaceae bacterium]|nr:sugar nucleotide-binding protein [Flavobacteriaceae bacterium]